MCATLNCRKRSWKSQINTVKFAVSKKIEQLKDCDVKLFLKRQSHVEHVQYVRYCDFKNMQLSSGLLAKREKKYRDTVVVVDCDVNGYQNFFIELLFYSNDQC